MIFDDLLLQKALLKHFYILQISTNKSLNHDTNTINRKTLQTVHKELTNINLILVLESPYLKVYRILEKIIIHKI